MGVWALCCKIPSSEAVGSLLLEASLSRGLVDLGTQRLHRLSGAAPVVYGEEAELLRGVDLCRLGFGKFPVAAGALEKRSLEYFLFETDQRFSAYHGITPELGTRTLK